jgi:hypothetical protein
MTRHQTMIASSASPATQALPCEHIADVRLQFRNCTFAIVSFGLAR